MTCTKRDPSLRPVKLTSARKTRRRRSRAPSRSLRGRRGDRQDADAQPRGAPTAMPTNGGPTSVISPIDKSGECPTMSARGVERRTDGSPVVANGDESSEEPTVSFPAQLASTRPIPKRRTSSLGLPDGQEDVQHASAQLAVAPGPAPCIASPTALPSGPVHRRAAVRGLLQPPTGPPYAVPRAPADSPRKIIGFHRKL